MNELKKFADESTTNINEMMSDSIVNQKTQEWMEITGPHKYAYNWRWLGLPIIQMPADVVATQELIWKIEPTVIIETGVARGGSLIFNASQLAMLDLCKNGSANIVKSRRRCIGIDIDIRSHNRAAIEAHPLSPMIHMLEGSSIENSITNEVNNLISPQDTVMVVLDSNHTFAHVKEELARYSPLVSVDSYIIVHDTGIEYSPSGMFENRDWGVDNNPFTAVREFLKENDAFKIDKFQSGKLLISSSPDGYLKRIK